MHFLNIYDGILLAEMQGNNNWQSLIPLCLLTATSRTFAMPSKQSLLAV